MRRVLIAVGLVGAVLAGCGGTGANCEPIADEGIELLQSFIDEIEGLSPDELMEAAADPNFIADIEEQADELDAKADAEGCSEEQMRELLEVRAESLEAQTEVGQIIVDLILDDAFFAE
ncbi:MAG: hypothetical protein QNJ88_07100 [Acidimicrobiia bacterium]|nr:hypothetical protein [Acidimicrobiia bacterium]